MKNTFIQGLNLKENSKGGLYHGETFDANLDLFALKGRRDDASRIQALFTKALLEDRQLALKNLLNFIDIRGGKGERRASMIMLETLVFDTARPATTELYVSYVKGVESVLKAIVDLGRWDMLVNLEFKRIEDNLELYTQDQHFIANIITRQLKEDIEGATDHKAISLLAKGLPSINASSDETRKKGKLFAALLGVDAKTYRQTLSGLRKHINVLEVNMSAKKYDQVDYSKVPSQALRRHVQAFYRNDKDRFEEYKAKLVKGETKANAGAIGPSQIVWDVISGKDTAIADGQWKNLPNFFETDRNVLVMADVSGSMQCGNGVEQPLNSSIALALYTSERNKGAFHNTFMTFHHKPELVRVVEGTISQKINQIARASWGMTTNIDAAFDLVLKATLNADKADCPEFIVIVSDMEFDSANQKQTNFQHGSQQFNSNGLTLPKIVFWNVALQTNGFPVTKITPNVAMVSGESPSIIEKLFDLAELTPVKMMNATLEKYNEFFE